MGTTNAKWIFKPTSTFFSSINYHQCKFVRNTVLIYICNANVLLENKPFFLFPFSVVFKLWNETLPLSCSIGINSSFSNRLSMNQMSVMLKKIKGREKKKTY